MKFHLKTKIALAALTVVCFVWLGLTFNLLPVYYYESSDRARRFVEYPHKGHRLHDVEQEFLLYERDNPGVKLKRATPIPWWSPWDWYDILTHPRWDYEYMTPTPWPEPHKEEEVLGAD